MLRFISAILILVYPVIIRKYNEVNHRDRAQMNINTMTSVQFPDHRILIDYGHTTEARI
jgi:hypothetical protein